MQLHHEVTPLSQYYDYGLCCLSLCYEGLVGIDDTGYLLGVSAYSVGEGPALDDVAVIKRYFYRGYLLVDDIGCKRQRIFFEKTIQADQRKVWRFFSRKAKE